MIAIVDYGMGNLRSVEKAFEKVDVDTKVTTNPKDIDKASGVVVPGVGAFSRGMENLEAGGLKQALLGSIKSGRPYLGICLGLQFLFDLSREEGTYEGFGIIKGEVVSLPQTVKVPHMGWNQIRKIKEVPILANVPADSYFYFVHSYYGVPSNQDEIAAVTDYGIEFASSVWKDNIYAVQFHPEKSGDIGLKILTNFGELCQE